MLRVKRLMATLLTITVLFTFTGSIFAEDNIASNGKKHITSYEINGITYTESKEKISQGYFKHTINKSNSDKVYEIYVKDSNEKREVKCYINDKFEAKAINYKDKCEISLNDKKYDGYTKKRIHKEVNLSNKNATKEPLVSIKSLSYLDFLHRTDLGVDMDGYLYGEIVDQWTEYWDVILYEGFTEGTCIAIILAACITGGPISVIIGNLLIGTGVAMVGFIWDGNYHVIGECEHVKWHYEVYARASSEPPWISYEGLDTTQTEITEVLTVSELGNVEQYESTRGYDGSRTDMLYAGTYSVYVWYYL